MRTHFRGELLEVDRVHGIRRCPSCGVAIVVGQSHRRPRVLEVRPVDHVGTRGWLDDLSRHTRERCRAHLGALIELAFDRYCAFLDIRGDAAEQAEAEALLRQLVLGWNVNERHEETLERVVRVFGEKPRELSAVMQAHSNR